MTQFPSELPFSSFYQYSPHGTSAPSCQSKEIIKALMQEGFHAAGTSRFQVIPRMVARIEAKLGDFAFLSELFCSAAHREP